MTVLQVAMTDWQLQLLDRVVGEADWGTSRPEVLRRILLEHVRYIEDGGSLTDTGGWTTIEVDRPTPGEVRDDIVLEPPTGKAIPVYKGEVLRITQLVGGQCVDFNAYNLNDYKEYLDCGFNRHRGFSTGEGTIVWTGSPRARPMYTILEISDTCDQYYAGHRCHALMYEKEYGLQDHPNCQDTFAEAIREYGLTPDDVHDSYNFWMSTILDADQRRHYLWNRGQKGDIVELVAMFDTLAVPIICGGDLTNVNRFTQQPIGVTVLEASASTRSLVEAVERRFTGYRSQRTPDDFKIEKIKADRALTRDPNYEPEFLPGSETHIVSTEVSMEEESMLQALVESEEYGPIERVHAAAFCRWYASNRLVDRYTNIAFR